MKYDVRQLTLISNDKIADGIYDMRLEYAQDDLPVSAASLRTFMCPENPCADLFRYAIAQTACSGLSIRSRAKAQKLCRL